MAQQAQKVIPIRGKADGTGEEMTDLKNLPEPLTPSFCDLRDYDYMPLHVQQFLNSEFTASVDLAALGLAICAWAASWHEIPAASLPNSDKGIAKLIGLGRDTKTFLEHKEEILYGWVLCSDNRWYHPVIAAKALNSFVPKTVQRIKSGLALKARWNTDFDPRDISLQLHYAFKLLKSIDPLNNAVVKGIPEAYHPKAFGIDDEYIKNTSSIPEEYQDKLKVSISESINIPPNPPRGKRKAKAKGSENTATAFDHFWKNMKTPKAAKKSAERAFTKATKGMDDEKLREFLLMILKDQSDRMKIIGEADHPFKSLHPATYLNQERWTDEMPKVKGGKSAPADSWDTEGGYMAEAARELEMTQGGE